MFGSGILEWTQLRIVIESKRRQDDSQEYKLKQSNCLMSCLFQVIYQAILCKHLLFQFSLSQ